MSNVTSKMAGQWSKGPRFEHLSQDREGLWDPDFVAMIARELIGIEPGMTIADVGCGLGYLGDLYHPFALPEGRYIGIDIDQDLLDRAADLVAGSDRGPWCEFVHSDAGAIQLADGIADVTMCQTLLMHVCDPLNVVREMKRITRPGGKVVAFEPDNTVSSGYSTVYEPTLEEKVRRYRVMLTMAEGRRRSGYGDWAMGPKLPYIFHQAGLRDIAAKTSDQVFRLVPPYETPGERRRIEHMQRWLSPARRRHWRDESMAHFLAGGGERAELEQVWAEDDERDPELLAALANGDAVIVGGHFFYAVVGTVGDVGGDVGGR